MAQTFITASVVFRQGTDILTVRKRGTSRYMLPGGKLEPGETPVDAAVREASEEVGAVLDPAELVLLGHFRAPAANEPGAVVVSDVFLSGTTIEPTVAGEIDDYRWTDAAGPLPEDIAPLLADCVIPALDVLPVVPSPAAVHEQS